MTTCSGRSRRRRAGAAPCVAAGSTGSSSLPIIGWHRRHGPGAPGRRGAAISSSCAILAAANCSAFRSATPSSCRPNAAWSQRAARPCLRPGARDMPQALPLLALAAAPIEAAGAGALGGIATAAGLGGLSGSVTIFGLSAGASAFLTGTVVLGATVGLSLALSPSAPSQAMEKPQSTIKQALPARFIPIGQVLVGGAVHLYSHSSLAPARSLVVGKIISCAPINAVEKIFWNNVVEALSSTPTHQRTVGVVSNTYNGQIQCEVGFGPFNQVTSPFVRGAISDCGFGLDSDRAQGLAYIIVRYMQGTDVTNHHNIYPSGAPDVSVQIRGVGLPDPRLGQNLGDETTWTYSTNSALAILRFVLDRDGWGHTPDHYDINSFITAANVCDQDMGGGAARYSSCG